MSTYTNTHKAYYKKNRKKMNQASKEWQKANRVRYLWLLARARARKKGVPFTLEEPA